MFNCWRAKRLFTVVLEDAAEPPQKAFVMEHLDLCPRCGQLYKELQLVDSLARESLKEIPAVDWAAFEEKTLALTMEKLARRGRLKRRAKSG